MEEMKSLRDKMKDASEADRKELQEKMKNLYEQIKALPQPPGSRPANPSRPEGRGDVQGRISHLRVAAENLRAAGMGDMADQILKRIEHLQAESREGARPPATPPRGETTRSGPGGPPSREATGPGRGEGPVSELRNEVQQMRREMQELREQVRRLVEKQSSPR
jgi:DNA repair exonuclease SbcCD ATPase subunit